MHSALLVLVIAPLPNPSLPLYWPSLTKRGLPLPDSSLRDTVRAEHSLDNASSNEGRGGGRGKGNKRNYRVRVIVT